MPKNESIHFDREFIKRENGLVKEEGNTEVQGELEMLFEKQYILTETVTMQIRYRTKMMVIIGPYGGQCKNAIMERGQNRDQHIGVMLDFVQIKMVFRGSTDRRTA